MDKKEEYHDPDYPEAPVCVKNETPLYNEEEKIDKIKKIIHREFTNELEARENEVISIDQRMTIARRYLHQLRYSVVNNYYKDQKLQLTAGQINDDIAAQNEPTSKAEVAHLLRDGQRRLHPSVRKLIGKKTVDLDEIFKFRGPRNKTRKDYSAMLQARNYTISADSTKTLRPETQETKEDPLPETSLKPKKIPRHIEPKVENVLTLDEVTRNKMKHRYRIIIGNTSKYVPPASRLDRSTHKWLLYIRGPAHNPDLSAVVTSVTARLHHSYAPHHIVHLRKPPFHIVRRGWGEFPVRVELRFAQPALNRPAALEHRLALDRRYTGLQTLGAETVVDVWLYSTPEMLKYEFKEDDATLTQPESVSHTNTDTHTSNDTHTDTDTHTHINTHIDKNTQTNSNNQNAVDNLDVHVKIEPNESDNHITDNNHENDSWLDFFENQTAVSVDDMLVKDIKKESEEKREVERETFPTADVKIPDCIPANSDSPRKKRIMKYMDPTTGKIYYLEMDRQLDLSKVQEIVINSKGNVKTAKISPVKNGARRVKKGVSLLKPEVKNELIRNERNVDKSRLPTHIENDHCYLGFDFYENSDRFNKLDELKRLVCRMTSVRQVVKCLLKRIPIVCDDAKDPEYLKCFPFAVDSDEKYWKLDFAKRRNIEWSRAKLINKLLIENFKSDTEAIWRTKQILVYSRLHGYYPVRPESAITNQQTDVHTEWSSWNDIEAARYDSINKEDTPNPSEINSLSLFDKDKFIVTDCVMLSDSDEEIDVLNDKRGASVRKVCDSVEGLSVLPVASEEDRLRYLFIEKKCEDIGVELRNEYVGNGYSYSCVHAVLLSAMKSFAEDLIRESLAIKLTEAATTRPPPTWSGGSSAAAVSLRAGAAAARRRALVSRAGLAARRTRPAPL